MTLLSGSVFLEAGALLFQFWRTGMLNVSVVWRPITLMMMFCICCSTSKIKRNKMLKFLAVLYGIVAISDLVFFYLAVAFQDLSDTVEK